MSRTVVTIGYILLVPSFLGMLFGALMFFGVNAHRENASRIHEELATVPTYQSYSDAQFRRTCVAGVKQKNKEVGYYASQQLIEQYCECSLSTFKETGSEDTASQACLQKTRDGTLEQPSRDVDAFYFDPDSSETSNQSSDMLHTGLFSVIGSVSAVIIGITSFVGGLLGWLLVMKKRVLKCSFCGAVINAS